jgi:hypothetical protein
VFPGWQPTALTRDEGKAVERAWQSVLAGRGVDAEKRFRELLRKRPGSVPVETGLGYALLRQERPPDAARTFASVLARKADYVPALVGAAAAALRAGNGEAALQHLLGVGLILPEVLGGNLRFELGQLALEAGFVKVPSSGAPRVRRGLRTSGLVRQKSFTRILYERPGTSQRPRSGLHKGTTTMPPTTINDNQTIRSPNRL